MQSAPSKINSDASVGDEQKTNGGANGKSSGKATRSRSGIKSSASSESCFKSLWMADALVKGPLEERDLPLLERVV